jgi:hypothetical protein
VHLGFGIRRLFGSADRFWGTRPLTLRAGRLAMRRFSRFVSRKVKKSGGGEPRRKRCAGNRIGHRRGDGRYLPPTTSGARRMAIIPLSRPTARCRTGDMPSKKSRPDFTGDQKKCRRIRPNPVDSPRRGGMTRIPRRGEWHSVRRVLRSLMTGGRTHWASGPRPPVAALQSGPASTSALSGDHTPESNTGRDPRAGKCRYHTRFVGHCRRAETWKSRLGMLWNEGGREPVSTRACDSSDAPAR